MKVKDKHRKKYNHYVPCWKRLVSVKNAKKLFVKEILWMKES